MGAVAGAIRLVLEAALAHGIQDALAVGDAIAAADVDRGEALGAAALVAVAGVAGSGVRDELAEELVEGVSGEGVRDVDAGIFLAGRSWSWSERCPFSLVSAAREAVALKLVESEGWTCTSGSSLLASDFFPHRGVHSHELVGHRVQHQLPCVGPGRLVHGGAPAEVVMALCILRVLAGALGPSSGSLGRWRRPSPPFVTSTKTFLVLTPVRKLIFRLPFWAYAGRWTQPPALFPVRRSYRPVLSKRP